MTPARSLGWWRPPTLHHVPVRIISDGVDMRGDFVTFLSFVHFDDLLGVDGQHFVWVHHHAEEARVGLQESTGYMHEGRTFD